MSCGASGQGGPRLFWMHLFSSYCVARLYQDSGRQEGRGEGERKVCAGALDPRGEWISMWEVPQGPWEWQE